MDPIRVPMDALRDGVPHKVALGEKPVVLIRQGGTVSALAGLCPHAGAPLEKGAVCEGRLICPWHKAAFAVADGSVLEPPALTPLARYSVRIEGGVVVIVGSLVAGGGQDEIGSAGTIAIVGTGAAASGALALLRSRGHAGRMVLIGPETAPPYDRTVLSKMVIGGKMPAEAKPVLEEWPDRVERVTGEVVRLDAIGREIHLGDGRVIAYDQALVATGGTPKRPGLPGEGMGGVHLLRSVEDAASLVGSIERARHAVVLGAGFIGLEVASGLREREIAVTVVSSGAAPLANVFGERIGRRVEALHALKGVVFRSGQVARFEGGARVERTVLEDGASIDCDLVVLGTGVTPNVAFVEGVECQDGVVVDASLWAAPGLFAAGDIARFPYRGEQVRIEHWRLAQQHGWLAARNMLGDRAAYAGVPYFWTAQHGKRIDYLGHAAKWDEEVIEGDLEAMDFVAFLIKDGVVAAAVGCARDTQMARLSDAMRHRLTIAEARELASLTGCGKRPKAMNVTE